jgi:hypothetical protein
MPPDNAVGKQALAAAWALNQIGSQDYYNLCQRFVEQAYGTGGQYRSAGAAGNALNWGADPNSADVGDLVFFKPDASNGGAGHVGIYLGNGEMVSATNKGITRDNFLSNSYWKNLFVGFGDPPEQWKGPTSTGDLIEGAAQLAGNAKSAAGNPRGAAQQWTTAAWGAAAPYVPQLMAAAAKHEVPVNVLAGLLIQESGGKRDARSPAGALGLMQFMPGTARGMGIDPLDPDQAIDGGARYLKQLADQSGGDWSQAVGKYNAGPAGNLNNSETRNHITKVMGWADTIGNSMDSLGGGAGMAPTPPNPNRGRDRGGPGGGPTVGDVGQGFSNLGSGVRGLLDRIGAMSGQREPGGGTRQTVPGMPGMEGITSRTPAPRPTTVSIPVEEIQAALAKGGGALAELLNRSMQQGANAPVGGSIAQGLPLSPAAPTPGAPGGMRNDPDFLAGIAGQEDRDRGGVGSTPQSVAGPTGAGNKPKPQGWIDPNSVSSQIYKGIIGISNGLLEDIEADEAILAKPQTNENLLERQNAQTRLAANRQRLIGLAPQLRLIENEEAQGREGTVAPGSTPYMKKIPIYRKVDGKWTVEYIDNPNAGEDPSITNRNLAEAGATARNQADIAARLGISQGEIASRERISGAELGVRREEMGSREGIAQLQEEGATGRTILTTNTQRVTTALSQAVEQRRQDIDAQIRKGDLDLRTATEEFNQWYKQNVEAPLAILSQQRQTEQLKTQQQQAVTQRATGQAEHERGIATIGQQMYNTASDAYAKMIPLTVGEGWGQGFQNNLAAGGGNYTPNQGATYNVPESLDAFATRKVAEMLKGVSPYAQSILSAEGQMGAPGQSMGGQQMDALTSQATGVASNALGNPFQMPQQQPFQMPGQVDIGGMAGAGMPGMEGQLKQELDGFLPQQIPQYGA